MRCLIKQLKNRVLLDTCGALQTQNLCFSLDDSGETQASRRNRSPLDSTSTAPRSSDDDLSSSLSLSRTPRWSIDDESFFVFLALLDASLINRWWKRLRLSRSDLDDSAMKLSASCVFDLPEKGKAMHVAFYVFIICHILCLCLMICLCLRFFRWSKQETKVFERRRLQWSVRDSTLQYRVFNTGKTSTRFDLSNALTVW